MQRLLLVCAGSMCACTGTRDLFTAEPYAGGKCEINYFSYTSCTQTGSVNLTLLLTAVAPSLGAITRRLIPQESTVVPALHRQAVP